LVVEDEPITLMDEIMALQDLGYVLAGSALSGEVAIQIAEEERPDVILMDIMLLTSMSGVVAADEIRRRFGTPVVFVSALGDQDAFDSGRIIPPKGVRYIVKPFDKVQLAAAIEAVLAD
jgi:hypothetical protein